MPAAGRAYRRVCCRRGHTDCLTPPNPVVTWSLLPSSISHLPFPLVHQVTPFVAPYIVRANQRSAYATVKCYVLALGLIGLGLRQLTRPWLIRVPRSRDPFFHVTPFTKRPDF